MGFLADVRSLQRSSAELSRNFDPAAQMRAAGAQLQHLTQTVTIASSPTAVTAPATVVGFRDTGMLVDNQPVVDLDVTVVPASGLPFAATARVQGLARVAGIVPGATVAVRYERNDPTVVALV